MDALQEDLADARRSLDLSLEELDFAIHKFRRALWTGFAEDLERHYKLLCDLRTHSDQFMAEFRG